MQRILTSLAAAALALGAASPAMASGGRANGGGAAGGGGSANSGGVNDPAPAPAAPPCATFSSATAPVGYYSVYAAVWNDYTIRSCSAGNEVVNVRVTESDPATGRIDYDITYPSVLSPGQNVSMVLDNDFAPFDTTYDVSYSATDSSTGAVLDTRSLSATTPSPR